MALEGKISTLGDIEEEATEQGAAPHDDAREEEKLVKEAEIGIRDAKRP